MVNWEENKPSSALHGWGLAFLGEMGYYLGRVTDNKEGDLCEH